MKIVLFLISSLFSLTALAEPLTTHDGVSSISSNPDVESQVAGEYPTLQRQESLPLGAIQHAWDNAKSDSGVYVVNFRPNEIIKVTVREFMTTTIVFPVWEKIIEIDVGDQSNYQVSKPTDNIVFIRPNGYVGLDSSITMIGESGHVYGFYVRSEGYNSKNISDIKIHVSVPAPFLKEGKLKKRGDLNVNQKEKSDYLEAVMFDPAKLDFNFSMSCDRTIAPLRVFSDGIRTWFDYGEAMGSKTLPTIYAVIDGVDTPINVNREGKRLVAEGSGKFSLRNGNKVTCVYPTQKGS